MNQKKFHLQILKKKPLKLMYTDTPKLMQEKDFYEIKDFKFGGINEEGKETPFVELL